MKKDNIHTDDKKIKLIKKVQPISSKEVIFFSLFPLLIRIIIVAIIVCLLFWLLLFLLNKNENENERIANSFYEDITRKFMAEQPNVLKFDENNTAILKMDWFWEYDLSFRLNPIEDDEGNLCNGYIIVKKVGDDYEFNFDYMCNQIDY